jgi:hypothetical protein
MKWWDRLIERLNRPDRMEDILQAIWDVRLDREGLEYWEITSYQLFEKLGERYSIGAIHVDLDSLERRGLIRSIRTYQAGRRRLARTVFMTPKGIWSQIQRW